MNMFSAYEIFFFVRSAFKFVGSIVIQVADSPFHN